MSNVHHPVRELWRGTALGRRCDRGSGTVIEVADKAVLCECGAGVEEEKGTLVETPIVP